MVLGNKDTNTSVKIEIEGQRLDQVRSFRYLGSTITENATSEQEIKNRIGHATSAMVKLSAVWGLKGISLKNRMKISKAIAWATLLYGCESWTLSQKSINKLKAFEMKCYRRMLNITWKERKTNEFVWEKLTEILGGRPESIIDIIKKRKLKYFGHQIRKQAMAKVLIEGIVEGTRGRGRPRRQWEDDLREWTGCSLATLSRKANDRLQWRRCVYEWVHPRST